MGGQSSTQTVQGSEGEGGSRVGGDTNTTQSSAAAAANDSKQSGVPPTQKQVKTGSHSAVSVGQRVVPGAVPSNKRNDLQSGGAKSDLKPPVTMQQGHTPATPGVQTSQGDPTKNAPNNASNKCRNVDSTESTEAGKNPKGSDSITNQQNQSRIERFKYNWYIQELNLVPNNEAFECPICYSDIDQDAGVQLHECLDCVCRDCLKNHILAQDTAEVKCPCSEGGHDCQSLLLEREIKELLTTEEYNSYQARCIHQAQAGALGKIRCPKSDCGWWAEVIVGEVTVQFIECPKCRCIICVSCAAIHDGQSCEEYQASLRGKKDIDETEQTIQEGIDKGELMKCPGCGLMLNKMSGCDWVQCLSCKLEICWATKQRRWGPNGRGDTTAGCKCRSIELGGQMCHPNCNNCH